MKIDKCIYFAGLGVTALVSFGVAQVPFLVRLSRNPIFMIAGLLLQFGLVFSLTGRVQEMDRSRAVMSFMAYAVLTGINFSVLFMAFSMTAMIKAFLSVAVVFGVASIYGSFAKGNVRGWGRYLTMGLFGILFATMLNMFFYSSTMDLVISIVGVVLFTGLTVWDTGRICEMNAAFGSSLTEDEFTKLGIVGALDLYLDFLNIFLYLLRFTAASDNN